MIHSLYLNKQSSADGRLFIWRESILMFTQNPFEGVGFGYFSRAFSLHEANYFSNDGGTSGERMIGQSIPFAFNDYLEFFVNGGLFCGIGYLIFMGSLIIAAWPDRHRLPECFAGIIAFAGMSFFNYGIYAYTAMLAFLIYASALQSDSSRSLCITRVLSPFILLFAIGWGLFSFSLTKAQYEVKSANDAINSKNPKKAVLLLEKADKWSQTSEYYYRVMGKYYMSQLKFDEAAVSFEKALRYTSTTDLLENTASCYLNIGLPETALYYLDISSNIQPSRFTPRYRMMHIYRKMGLNDKAKEMADCIGRMPVKIDSDEVRRIKANARALLTGKQLKPHNKHKSNNSIITEK